MRGAFLYVNAGKGHYTPAVALSESFSKMGHEAILEDLFITVNSPFWEWFCKNDWRFLLHFPRLEGTMHGLTDNKLSNIAIQIAAIMPNHVAAFKKWYEANKPDFIVSTNFIGGVVLPPILKKLKIHIPVFQYCADAFDTPKTGIFKMITKMYAPTDIGCRIAIRKGQPVYTVSKCPFPLQAYIKNTEIISKEDARKKLGLKNKPTVLMGLGGEGIGNTEFLDKMLEKGYNWQVVAIGGKSKTTEAAFKRFTEEHPEVDFYHPGFVKNVNEYLLACDIQIGKAGANALMESLYLHRPFIISQLLYTARPTKNFFDEYRVGWAEGNVSRQVDIVARYFTDAKLQEEVAEAFKNLPIEFSADKFIELILKDYEEYRKKNTK